MPQGDRRHVLPQNWFQRSIPLDADESNCRSPGYHLPIAVERGENGISGTFVTGATRQDPSYLSASGGNKAELEIDVVRSRFQEPAKLHRPYAGNSLGVRRVDDEHPRFVEELGRNGDTKWLHAIITFVRIPFSVPPSLTLILLCHQIPLESRQRQER